MESIVPSGEKATALAEKGPRLRSASPVTTSKMPTVTDFGE